MGSCGLLLTLDKRSIVKQGTLDYFCLPGHLRCFVNKASQTIKYYEKTKKKQKKNNQNENERACISAAGVSNLLLFLRFFYYILEMSFFFFVLSFKLTELRNGYFQFYLSIYFKMKSNFKIHKH